ncbi:minor tail protein [Microbacterium phage Araxxi]|uniref:Minor tail protein n=1 Tax=Microbacterium phage Araxxi TaxID=2590948 RepID=A0A516KT63_9CAUD|nr:hypothetical protein HWC57_gp31 [Microbacterium phage Araxxi]QDP44850.1 minor tail protein [Microbacterium phage Araxxi]
MTYIGNTPQEQTVLRLEAAKSFSFNVWVQDQSGRALDITGATARIVMKKPPFDPADTSDTTNLITNDDAILVDAPVGLMRFDLQAADLNLAQGEYPYVIVFEKDGYSFVMVKGVVQILANGELTSIGDVYVGTDPAAQQLIVSMAGPKSINVYAGGSLAPGTTSFTDADKAKLDGIDAGAQLVPEYRLIPPGGNQGSVLTKMSSATDFTVGWAQPSGGGGGGGGIDPTGIPDGYVPTANGADGWDWEPADPVSISADIIVDSATKVMMTPAERAKLMGLNYPPQWGDIAGKPMFGTVALLNTSQVLQPGGVNAATDVTAGVLNNARVPRVGELRGITSGTAAPSGGSDGDIYIQYT